MSFGASLITLKWVSRFALTDGATKATRLNAGSEKVKVSSQSNGSHSLVGNDDAGALFSGSCRLYLCLTSSNLSVSCITGVQRLHYADLLGLELQRSNRD